ncbi:hypothetical protein BDV95DRAFT_15666 [Massariosphaeria phaeospora]|uniref:Cupin type-2 domain-containing protein n=1 Tax=Massariosphaeria phaeospora TaxID=100035 RepID=A0A7C8IRE7_9PLEO|nr:hypothetical protein BDV95DRAFT_15666 [Massariosphaeria phaeospora]
MPAETRLPVDVKPKHIATVPPGITNPERRHIRNPVQKNWATVQKYGRETNGAYGVGVTSVAPGGKNDGHFHGSYSETFTSLKGNVGIYTKSRGRIILKEGESATVPPREEHYWFNDGDEEVEIEVKIEPAMEGFEKGLYVMYGLAQDGKGGNAGVANSIVDTAIICSMADMWPGGVIGTTLIPLLKSLAWVGRKTGKEDKLLKKYWA